MRFPAEPKLEIERSPSQLIRSGFVSIESAAKMPTRRGARISRRIAVPIAVRAACQLHFENVPEVVAKAGALAQRDLVHTMDLVVPREPPPHVIVFGIAHGGIEQARFDKRVSADENP